MSQCSESDVNELCKQLELTLIDKLKFKQALKSVNIPREPVQYAIINQDEQNAIREIQQSIKKVESLIMKNNGHCKNVENKFESDKSKICAVFDSIHQIINERKENILNSLEQNFENEKIFNKQLIQYLEEATKTKTKCQQLILNKNHLSRNQSVIDLKNKCLLIMQQILKSNKTCKISINHNIINQRILKSIDDLVVIEENKYSDCNNDENQDCSNNNNNNNTMSSFSGVKVIDGFKNAKWGNNNKTNQEFGSFDNNATFNINSIKHNDKHDDKYDDNCSEITFKPIIELKEKVIDDGHKNEQLLKSFNIKSLYYWGKNAINQSTWKLRASTTIISFYKDDNRTRLICRETLTNKLRMNHYVPSKQNANLNCKSDKLIIWTAIDTTLDGNVPSTFCAKFSNATFASEFKLCFEECQ